MCSFISLYERKPSLQPSLSNSFKNEKLPHLFWISFKSHFLSYTLWSLSPSLSLTHSYLPQMWVISVLWWRWICRLRKLGYENVWPQVSHRWRCAHTLEEIDAERGRGCDERVGEERKGEREEEEEESEDISRNSKKNDVFGYQKKFEKKNEKKEFLRKNMKKKRKVLLWFIKKKNLSSSSLFTNP